jgi:hypothetical protein
MFNTYDLPDFPEPEWSLKSNNWSNPLAKIPSICGVDDPLSLPLGTAAPEVDPINLLADGTKPMSLSDDLVSDMFEFTSLEDQATGGDRLTSHLDLDHALGPDIETLPLATVDERRIDPTTLINSHNFPACPPNTLARENQQHTSRKASVPVTGTLGDINNTILESVERADPVEDNIEQRRSAYLTKWDSKLAKHEFQRAVNGSLRRDTTYQKVAVLLLSWSDELDDLGCDDEVEFET